MPPSFHSDFSRRVRARSTAALNSLHSDDDAHHEQQEVDSRPTTPTRPSSSAASSSYSVFPSLFEAGQAPSSISSHASTLRDLKDSPKRPNRTDAALALTHNRDRTESPSRRRREDGDRFISNRPSAELRATYNLIPEGGPPSPSRSRAVIAGDSDAQKDQANRTFHELLTTELFSPDEIVAPPSPPRSSRNLPVATPPETPTKRRRIFDYTSSGSRGSGSATRHGLESPNHHAYSSSPVKSESQRFLLSPRKPVRVVSKTPYKVLDAPDLADDFYLNLVDWSSTNVLGVGLGSCVYLWSAFTSKVTKLCDLTAEDPVTSLSWAQKGSTLAIGTTRGLVHIWDAERCEHLRTMEGHSARVGALAWSNSTLSSGSRDRSILLRDVRSPSHHFRALTGHRQEVCGLKWNSYEPSQLASGGNDNKLFVWDGAGSGRDQPLWKFHEHSAAVKAISWAPWERNILASGGGTLDKKLRFWNTGSGTLVNELDTGSQVCNLTWSLNSNELVSTHGFSSTQAQNQVCIWKYPSLDQTATFTGHTHRVLYLAMSPDGRTIVTGAGDETLRFWNAFPEKKDDRRREPSVEDLLGQIR